MLTDIFIDFDDTLYDTHGNAVIALKETFDHFHLADVIADEDEFYRDYWDTNVMLWDKYSHGLITRDYLIIERFRHPLALAPALNTKTIGFDVKRNDFPAATREFCIEVSDYFLGRCAMKAGVVEGAYELMDYLKHRGYHLHIASNGFHEIQYKKLRASRLYDYFDTIILSEDAGANKPHPGFFQYAFEQIRKTRPDAILTEDTCIMIGDNIVSDILGAKRAGLQTIYFNPKGTPRLSTVEGYPDPVDHEVHKLTEIKTLL